MLIDFHHHLPLNPPCPYTDSYAEAIEEISDRFGIDYLCVNAPGPLYRNRTNEECLALARRCPRVIPFFYIHMDGSDADAVNRALGMGFRGLKFISPVKDFDDPSYMPLYEAAARHGLPCLFHTGIVGHSTDDAGERISSARMRPIFLDTIARRFPELTIVGAHLGAPWVEEAVSVMAYNPNVYFDLSGMMSMGTVTTDFFRRPWLFGFKWEKIVFATDAMIRDFGFIYEKHRQVLAELEVPQAVREGVFGKTAAQMLGLDTP